MGVAVEIGMGPVGDYYALPAERTTVWSPGIPGGIPSAGWTQTTLPNYENYYDGVADATSAIQAALDSAAGNDVAVYLPAGSYNLQGALNLQSHSALRGAGPSTKLYCHDSFGIWTSGYPSWGNVVDCKIAGDWQTIAKGADRIPVASTSGYSVGDFIILDQVDLSSRVYTNYDQFARSPTKEEYPLSPDGWRAQGEVHQILSISGNDLVIYNAAASDPDKGSPIHIEFAASQHPQVWKSTSAYITWCGVEDLWTTGGLTIRYLASAYCWIKGVESDHRASGVDGAPASNLGGATHFEAQRCYRIEVRSSYWHHSGSYSPASGSYGLTLDMHTSDTLVEDNIGIHMMKPILCRGTGGGTVIAYNYFDDAISDDSNQAESCLDVGHHSYPYMILLEGNWTAKIGLESYWGGGGYITSFRNYAAGKNSHYGGQDPDNAYDQEAVRVEWMYLYCSVIGNVLGVDGYHTSYEVTSAPPGTFAPVKTIYQISNRYRSSWTTGDGVQGDGQVYQGSSGLTYTTLLRHANYDYYNDATQYNGSDEHNLPDSLYLSSKPSFFGSDTWPWVEPDGATKLYTLPAKARYDAM